LCQAKKRVKSSEMLDWCVSQGETSEDARLVRVTGRGWLEMLDWSGFEWWGLRLDIRFILV